MGEKTLSISRNSLDGIDYAENKIIAQTPLKDGYMSRQYSRPNTS